MHPCIRSHYRLGLALPRIPRTLSHGGHGVTFPGRPWRDFPISAMACLSQGGHRVKLTTSVQCRSLRKHGPISVPSLHTSLRCGAEFSKRANLPLVHVQKRECVLLVQPSRPRVKQPFTTTVRIIRMCVLICLYCNRVNFLVLQVCMTQAKCLRVVTLVFPPGRVS